MPACAPIDPNVPAAVAMPDRGVRTRTHDGATR